MQAFFPPRQPGDTEQLSSSTEESQGEFAVSLKKRVGTEKATRRNVFDFDRQSLTDKHHQLANKIRQANRINAITQRRKIAMNSGGEEYPDPSYLTTSSGSWSETIQVINDCKQQICQDQDLLKKLAGLKQLRDVSAQLVSVDKNCYMGVALVMESALVPCLCHILKSGRVSCWDQHNPFSTQIDTTALEVELDLVFQIKIQVAWIFINLSMGNQKQQTGLMKRGVVQALISQTQTYFNDVQPPIQLISLCIWALGNFAVGSQEIRDKIICEGVVPRLAHLFDVLQFEQDMRKEIIFFFHNCFVADDKGRSRRPVLPPLGKSIPAIRTLSKVLELLNEFDGDINSMKQDEMLTNVLHSLCLVSEVEQDILGSLAEEYGFHKSLVKLLDSNNTDVKISTLILITRLCALSKEEKHVVQFLQVGQGKIILAFKNILEDQSDTNMKCKVLLALSNFASDKNPLVLQVLLESDLYSQGLFPLLMNDILAVDEHLQSELAYAFSNVFLYLKDFAVIRQLAFGHNFMAALVKLLERGNKIKSGLVSGVALEGLTLMFREVRKFARKSRALGLGDNAGEEFYLHLESLGGVDLIEQSQEQPSKKVYTCSRQFLLTHFEEDLEDYPPLEKNFLLSTKEQELADKNSLQMQQ